MTHRVLLVDDEPLVLAALQRTLRRDPFALATASSAEEALLMFADGGFDAVVTDHDMPGGNGNDLLARIHRLAPSTVKFMLTGKPTLGKAIEAVNRGEIHRFFIKPCDGAELSSSLRQCLMQRDLLEESRRLLVRVRQQEHLLKELELHQPGLSRVDRDDSGRILLESVPVDLEGLLSEIERTTGARS